jgi:hypothetical protein
VNVGESLHASTGAAGVSRHKRGCGHPSYSGSRQSCNHAWEMSVTLATANSLVQSNTPEVSSVDSSFRRSLSVAVTLMLGAVIAACGTATPSSTAGTTTSPSQGAGVGGAGDVFLKVKEYGLTLKVTDLPPPVTYTISAITPGGTQTDASGNTYTVLGDVLMTTPGGSTDQKCSSKPASAGFFSFQVITTSASTLTFASATGAQHKAGKYLLIADLPGAGDDVCPAQATYNAAFQTAFDSAQ